MQLLTGIFIAIGWIILLPIMRFATTFIHEIGHAIPALLFTSKPVDVYIGSYGDLSKTMSFSIGRLNFIVRFDIFDWKIGMCVPHGRSSWLGSFFIILGGPIASILICGAVLIYLNGKPYPDYILIIALAMFLLGIVDLLVNLIPASTQYRNEDGKKLVNDGKQLVELFSKRNLPDSYFPIQDLIYQEKFDKAASELQTIINDNPNQPKAFYDLLIECYLNLNNHEKVIDTYEGMVDFYPLVISDYRTIGLSYYRVNNYEESIRCLNEYLFTHYNDYEANLTRGLSRMYGDDLEEAYKDFKAAYSFSNSKNVTYPLSHMGNIMTKVEQYDEALFHLENAQKEDKLNENKALAYYWAVYYEKVNNYENALKYFIKAQKSGYEFHGYEYKIYDMEEAIKNSRG